MSYYISVKTSRSFDKAIELAIEALKTEGFGILSRIDVKATLKEKLNVDFKNYIILGACNPHYAYHAFQIEDKIGNMMPCNVTIIQQDNDHVEISAMDPTTALNVIENENLQPFASEIKQKLIRCMAYISEEDE